MFIAKGIVYFGQPAVILCDANCAKAWGVNGRPKVQLSENEDDFAFLADGELGTAPEDPGTEEGGQRKPEYVADRLNKWCCRECERCVMARPNEEFQLKDFSVRRKNMGG